jgi:hypothetical protein
MSKPSKIYNLLFEQEANVDTPETGLKLVSKSTDVKARKALSSIDDQIDALILKYEASSIRDESIVKSDNLMERSLDTSSLEYLFEQEEEEVAAEEAPAEEGGEEESAPVPTGSEAMDVDEPGEEEVPDLDIDAFAMRTVRLIMNYKNLLRVEEAIVNRIKNFLDENYGENFVDRYVSILENEYGISMAEFASDRETEDEEFAVGAFAGGMGSSGA